MAGRLSKEKAQAIAVEYCKNSHKKVLGLLAVGYSETYAKSGRGSKVYDNVLVKKAIADLESRTAERAEMTVERMHKQYDEDRKFARTVNAAGAAVSASVSTARLYGMDKDAGVREQTVIIISPKVDRRPVIDSQGAAEGDKEG